MAGALMSDQRTARRFSGRPRESAGTSRSGPIAPQTASVGVSTSVFVRREGQVIRHNLPWTLVLLAYLLLIALFYRGVLPAAMQP
jgi:lactate permease